MQGIDYLGVPTKVAWKPFYSQLPPPALRGPGGFGQLPPLRKNRPAIIEAGPMETGPAVVVDEGPADDEVTYWFGVMQNKMRERFAEVRPAGAMSTRLPACLFSSHAPHNTHHVPSSSDALLVAARPACLPPPQSPLPVSSSLPSSVSSSLPSFSVFLTPLAAHARSIRCAAASVSSTKMRAAIWTATSSDRSCECRGRGDLWGGVFVAISESCERERER